MEITNDEYWKEKNFYNLQTNNGHKGIINNVIEYYVFNDYLTVTVNDEVVTQLRVYPSDRLQLCVTETADDISVNIVYVNDGR